VLEESPYLDSSDLVSAKPPCNLQSLSTICEASLQSAKRSYNLRSLPEICEVSLQSVKSPYNLQSLSTICDDLRSFPAIDSTNSSSINGYEPYIRLRITFRSVTLSCSAPPPYHTTISALSEAQQICQHAIALARAFIIRQQRAYNTSAFFSPFFHPHCCCVLTLIIICY
jgi:hypothetical protein